MTRTYHDISHFRAPYKNALIAGFGGGRAMYGYGRYNGYGTDPTLPGEVPPPPPAPGMDSFVVTSAKGYRFVKPELQETLMQTLAAYDSVFLSDTQVSIRPFTAEELAVAAKDPAAKATLESRSAANWVSAKAAAGQVVFMTTTALIAVLSGQQLQPGDGQLGTFPAGSAEAKEAAKSPLGVVIAGDPDPSKEIVEAGMSPLVIGLLVVGAVGGVFLVAKAAKGRRRTMPSSM